MTCTDIETRDIAERYLLGQLDDADRDAFEAHYFECARCYSEVEALRAVRAALARPARRSSRATDWPWLAAAAALVLGVSAILAWQSPRFRVRGPSSEEAAVSTPAGPAAPARTDEIARLAAVTPPPYAPTRFRSGVERAAFEAGMRRYAAQDFAGAIPSLEQAVRESPAAGDARFYLGASYLLVGRVQDAIAGLEPLAAEIRSPYAEEAHFLIAKAHLGAGNVPASLAALDKTIAIRGDREQDARLLRARVAALSPPR